MTNHVKLSVCLITFNHEKYILSSLEGITKQKTTFDFELIIGEDKSTDNTRKIVDEYLELSNNLSLKNIKKLYHDSNVGMSNNYYKSFEKCDGEYIAIVEGDDFWSDPYKLQKQVDILDQNPDCGLICSDFEFFDNFSGDYSKPGHLSRQFKFGFPTLFTLDNYLSNRQMVRTLTVVVRKKLVDAYLKEMDPSVLFNNSVVDVPIWIYVLSRSFGFYLQDTTAVYRVTQDTASRPVDLEKKELFQKTVSGLVINCATKVRTKDVILRKLQLNRQIIELEWDVRKREKSKVIRDFLKLLLMGKLSRTTVLLLLMGLNQNIYQKYREIYFGEEK